MINLAVRKFQNEFSLIKLCVHVFCHEIFIIHWKDCKILLLKGGWSEENCTINGNLTTSEKPTRDLNREPTENTTDEPTEGPTEEPTPEATIFNPISKNILTT